MTSRKKKPKPSIIVIMIARQKMSPPQPLILLMTTQKTNSYRILFIVNVINDCHNNSRAVKGR
jgi:hypothetical protein